MRTAVICSWQLMHLAQAVCGWEGDGTVTADGTALTVGWHGGRRMAMDEMDEGDGGNFWDLASNFNSKFGNYLFLVSAQFRPIYG